MRDGLDFVFELMVMDRSSFYAGTMNMEHEISSRHSIAKDRIAYHIIAEESSLVCLKYGVPLRILCEPRESLTPQSSVFCTRAPRLEIFHYRHPRKSIPPEQQFQSLQQ